MGILLCEHNFRDVWRRNKSVRAEIGKILRTHTHTHAAKLVVRIKSGKKLRIYACFSISSYSVGRFFGISDKSCIIFFSEFYQIMPCIMFADN